jgi:SAM-dependent methyltransferase
MRLATLLEVGRVDRLRALSFVARVSVPYYRACFLVGAASSRALLALASAPRTLAEIADVLEVPEAERARLAAWLDVGVRLGDLGRDGERYRLASRLAALLGDPANDDVLALLEEALTLHRALLVETPARLRARRPFTLADQDGAVIARSSRVLEPFVREAIERVVPRERPVRLLEIGCGTGTHIRHAAEWSPALTAVGLELQPEVASLARENVERWGLSGRVCVEQGDIRAREPDPTFDVVTLHNNIYYFPVEERVALLRRVSGSLAPGGTLLLTTGCRGGSPAMEVLSLWGAVTEGCGPLPTAEQMLRDLGAAGLVDARASSLLGPLDSYFAFTATSAGARP